MTEKLEDLIKEIQSCSTILAVCEEHKGTLVVYSRAQVGNDCPLCEEQQDYQDDIDELDNELSEVQSVLSYDSELESGLKRVVHKAISYEKRTQELEQEIAELRNELNVTENREAAAIKRMLNIAEQRSYKKREEK